MKKIYRFIYVTFSILCMLNLSSCSGEKTNTKAEIEKIQVDKLSESPVDLNITPKLNFDEAIIDIPDVNEMYSLKLTRPILNMQELTDEFTVSTEKFLDREIDKSMLKYRYSNGKDEPTYLGISDSPEFKLNFNMLSYTDEETYDDIFFLPYGMYWVANKSSVYSKNIHLGEFNILRFYDKNEKKQSEDFEFMENAVDKLKNEYSYFMPSDFNIKPYRYIDTDDIYYSILRIEYEGVPFNTDFFGHINETVKPLPVSDGGTFCELVIGKDGTIYRIASFSDLNIERQDTYTEIITPATACRLVDKEISDDVSFKVTRFDLLYNYEEIINENDETTLYYQSKPYWKITIEHTGIAEYPMLAFMVDAISGEVKTYKIV